MGMAIWFGAPIVATAQEATAPTGLTESTGDISTPSQVNGTGSFSEFQDFADLSIDELLNASISVASGAKSTLRKSPAIVTLVSRQQILSSGARDLADILRLVPGLDLIYDVYGTQGLSVRGLYANEGKVLVTLDGIPLNEYQYTTAQYNFHVPPEQIERIEIIRGPGSVLYGGYAALAVINIVTQGASRPAGGQAFVSGGSYADAFGHVVAGSSYGALLTNGVAIHAAASGGYANASNGVYEDFYGSTYAVPGNNVFRPWMARFGLRYKGLELETLYDQYDTLERDQYGDIVASGPIPNHFRQLGARAEYRANVGQKVRLVPSYLFQMQRPWLSVDTRSADSGNDYDVDTWRNTFGLRAESEPLAWLGVVVGADYYWEHHRNNLDAMAAGTNQIDYNDLAGYGQIQVEWKILSLLGGARYEWHDAAGSAFVPRAALGLVVQGFHSKILYARAFRIPSLMNLWSNPAIEPEIVDTYEGELGYQLASSMFFTVNGFVAQVDKPIVYGTDSAGYGNYFNYPRTGSWGLEGQVRYVHARGSVSATHSFSRPRDNHIPSYAFGVVNKRLLGQTANKFTIDGTAKIWRELSVNPSLIVYGRRDGFVSATQTRTFGSSALVNGYVRYAGLLKGKLELGAGVYNIFDDLSPHQMPYQSWHAAFPPRGREYVARIGYGL